MNLQERPTEIYPGFFLSDKITSMQNIVVEQLKQIVALWVRKNSEINNYGQKITAEECMKQLKKASDMLFPVHITRATFEEKGNRIGYFMCIDADNNTFKVELSVSDTESRFSTKTRVKSNEIEHVEKKYILYGSVFVLNDEIHVKHEKGKVFTYTAMYNDTKTRAIFDNTHVIEISGDGIKAEEKIVFINERITLPFPTMHQIYTEMEEFFDRSFENCTIRCFEIVDSKECERGAYVKKHGRFSAYGDTLSNGATLMVSRNNYGAIEWTYGIEGIINVKQDMEEAHKKKISIVASEDFMDKIDIKEFFSMLQEKARDFISAIEG
ncbi:MAG: hypothetical protein E7310_03265 [Clostridiales bacterium]|nr:hypothetical protein [Clostridiales bacterium]